MSGANLMIFSGEVTRDELLRQFGDIDEAEAASSNHWLIVDMGHADISDLSFDVLAQLKAVMEPKMKVMKARAPFDVAIVCTTPFNKPIYQTWTSFVGGDKDYPSNPLVLASLKAACDHLGYDVRQFEEVRRLCAEAS